MTPVITSPMAMENFPSVVEHTTGPPTFCGWPSTVTVAGPAAAAGLGAVAPVALVVALVELVVVADDVLVEDLLSLEQPATPATAIVATPTAIKNSRFTELSFMS
jgi:hypothetical protein